MTVICCARKYFLCWCLEFFVGPKFDSETIAKMKRRREPGRPAEGLTVSNCRLKHKAYRSSPNSIGDYAVRCGPDSGSINLPNKPITHRHSANASCPLLDVESPRPHRPIRSALLESSLGCGCLAACNLTTLDDASSRAPDAFDHVRSVDHCRAPDPAWAEHEHA